MTQVTVSTWEVNPEERLANAEDEVKRLRAALEAIKRATIEGRVCDDVAWYDRNTTLHDFCDQILNRCRETPELF